MEDFYKELNIFLLDTISIITIIECFLIIYILKKTPISTRSLSYYLIVCTLFNITNFILVGLKIQNLLLLPVFNLVELFILQVYIGWNFKRKDIIKTVTIIAVLINIYEFYVFYNEMKYSLNLGRIINAVLFIYILLDNLYKFKYKPIEQPLVYTMIFYFSVCFIQYFLYGFLTTFEGDSMFIIWIVYCLSECLFYSVATIYLWKTTKVIAT